MAKIAFIEHKFSNSSLSLLAATNKIMAEYARQNYRLTLRQLYYQMIARDLFPVEWVDPQTGTKNNIKNYKRFGDLINNGRLAGHLDWDYIEDRARETVFPSFWSSPASIVEACAQQFRFDKWKNQPNHIEVMVEKDAVSGILAPVCSRLQVRFTANRGYASSSLFYEVSQRLSDKMRDGKKVIILYFGDHDPSGMDMTRDIIDRMGIFTFDADIEVRRLALNMEQVEQWNPPENPAKETDSRFTDYRDQYGESCWELDAVEPRDLAKLVTDEVESLRDDDLWAEAVEKEDDAKARLNLVAETMKQEDEENEEDAEDSEDDD